MWLKALTLVFRSEQRLRKVSKHPLYEYQNSLFPGQDDLQMPCLSG